MRKKQELLDEYGRSVFLCKKKKKERKKQEM